MASFYLIKLHCRSPCYQLHKRDRRKWRENTRTQKEQREEESALWALHCIPTQPVNEQTLSTSSRSNLNNF